MGYQGTSSSNVLSAPCGGQSAPTSTGQPAKDSQTLTATDKSPDGGVRELLACLLLLLLFLLLLLLLPSASPTAAAAAASASGTWNLQSLPFPFPRRPPCTHTPHLNLAYPRHPF